jgi:phage replication O-like protein O
MTESESFVRLPTKLLETLLLARLSGSEWGIVLWVIRQTYGWNRKTAPFSWYRIAKDLALDRGGVVRAGQRLVCSGILRIESGELRVLEPQAMTNVSVDKRHRKAMTEIIASDDECHRNRSEPSSLFRRAKDSSKDRLKTYKDRPWNHRREDRETAGAAAPIPRKYERLSQN